MAGANLVFDIIANDRASSKFDRVGRAASGTTGPLSSMTGKLKTVAKWGAAAAVVAGAFAVKMGVDAVKAAAADEQAQAKLAGQLKRSTGASKDAVAGVEDWISKLSLASGVADDELRPALARLVTATGDITKAQDLATLAMDVSAGTGKSLESVSTALMKAQNGQIDGLSRLGIKTKDAEGNTLSFKDAVKGMQEQFSGAQAEKADTYQGKMDRLKVTWDEMKESIGAKLLPVLTRFGGWMLDKGIPAVKRMWESFKDGNGPIGKLVGWIRDDLWPALQKVGRDLMPTLRTAWDDVKEGFKDAQPVLEKIGQAFTDYIVPVMGKFIKYSLPEIVKGFKRVVTAINFTYDAIRFLWNNGFAPVTRNMLSVLGQVMLKFADMLGVIGSLPGAPKWMGDAANKLHDMGTNAGIASTKIKDIPKRVSTEYNFHTTYTYSGLRPPGGGGAGPTRGHDDEYGGVSGKPAPGASSPRMSSLSSDPMTQVVELLKVIAARTGDSAGYSAYVATGGF